MPTGEQFITDAPAAGTPASTSRKTGTRSRSKAKTQTRTKTAARTQSGTGQSPRSHAPFALLRAAVIEQFSFAERLQRMGLEMFGPSWGENLAGVRATGSTSSQRTASSTRATQRAQASTSQAASAMRAANAPPQALAGEAGETLSPQQKAARTRAAKKQPQAATAAE